MSSSSQDDKAELAHSDKDDVPSGVLNSPGSESPEKLDDSTVATPEAGEHLPVKCVLCEEEFKGDEDNELSPADELRKHMSSTHPATKQFSPLGHGESDGTPHPPRVVEDDEQLKRNQKSETSLQTRFEYFWDIHDVRNFAKDYGGDDSGVAELWARKLDGTERPAPYKRDLVPRCEFLPLTDPETLVEMLRNPWSRSDDELYAVTQNAAHALRVWQDEYKAIDKLRRKASDTDFKKKEPGRDDDDHVDNHVIFDNKRQAELYGYQYHDRQPGKQLFHEDRSGWGYQDPFWRSGRIPTSPQYNKLELEAEKKGTNNLDGWPPITIDGKEYIPKRRITLDEIAYLKHKEEKKEADKQKRTAGKQQAAAERVTRYGGVKSPSTSRARSAASSPAPTRGRGKRGRGASRAAQSTATSRPSSTPAAADTPVPPVRGMSTRAHAASKAAHVTGPDPESRLAPALRVSPPTQAPTQTLAPAVTPASSSTPNAAYTLRPEGRESRRPTAPTPHTSASALPALFPAAPQADLLPQSGHSLAGPGSPLKNSILAGPPLAAPSRTAPTRHDTNIPSRKISAFQPNPSQVGTQPLTDVSASDPSFAGSPATVTASPDYAEILQLPKNQEKLRKAKHPKRTAAMILHWEDFRANGRTRKPKRTKAQIEADRAAEAEAIAAATTNAGSTLPSSADNGKKRKQTKPGTGVFSVKKHKDDGRNIAGLQFDGADEAGDSAGQLPQGNKGLTS